ncbi:hypothetical protein PAUR_b1125 [Pseudoalteromonas aurantia 208]|uniref:Orphan protein n=1 Tax=Pseudoalteromonas aurantia 208 TaxID=1314867 RepID=A0ABR9EJ09_9GAMM|nr:hypothetical protein [Pseudoalteromonas aurantia 208]
MFYVVLRNAEQDTLQYLQFSYSCTGNFVKLVCIYSFWVLCDTDKVRRNNACLWHVDALNYYF